MGTGIGLQPDGRPPAYVHRPVIGSQLKGSREMGEMTRYERKLYFERLMALRDAYRAATHESTGMTIEQAMTFAERVFNDAVTADAAAVATALAKGAPKAV
jgi:hypothetical protein